MEEAEPLHGGDSPSRVEPSSLAPIAEEPPDVAMDEDAETPVPMAVEQGSEVSTMEPAMEPETPTIGSQPTSAGPSRSQSRRASLDAPPRNLRVDEGSGGTMTFGPLRDGPPPAVAMPYPSPPQGVPSWPRPSHSMYFEVSARPATMSPAWKLDRPTGKYTMNPPHQDRFKLHQAEAVFNANDRCRYLTKSKAKTSPGQVEFRNLGEKYKVIFRKARAKEVASLLNSGAIQILSVEESRKFAKENPDHVLTSRYVDRWKPTDAFGVLPEEFDNPGFLPENHTGLAPKSRWCVVGWRDPYIHQIDRAAPTPLTSSMYLGLQLASCRKWKTYSKDAKTAFLQSRPTTRKKRLACRMPSDEAFEGYHPEQLILLLTEVYGLVSGPAWWRRSLLEILVKELGYRVNVYDRCVLTLDGPLDEKDTNAKIPTRGFMILEVDDILEAGDAEHRKKMTWLESRLKFGKIVDLMDTENDGGSGYAGRRIKQHKDFSFSYSMDDYVANRLHLVKVHRKFLKDAATIKLNEEPPTGQLETT